MKIIGIILIILFGVIATLFLGSAIILSAMYDEEDK